MSEYVRYCCVDCGYSVQNRKVDGLCHRCGGKVQGKEGLATGCSVFSRSGRNLLVSENSDRPLKVEVEEADIPKLFRYIFREFGYTLRLTEEEFDELGDYIAN